MRRRSPVPLSGYLHGGMRTPLTCDEFVAVLDQWVGHLVAVRVVTDSDELLAVFCGALSERSDEKHPALFWPLTNPGQVDHPERPGLYLHPEHFQTAALHMGATVVELRQDGVTLNLRRL